MYKAQLQVLARAAHWPVFEYSEEFFSLTPAMIGELRELSYLDQWKVAREKSWFHLVLEDHSLLQFSETGDSSSFSFLQCPLAIPTFREYLAKIGAEYTAQERREHQAAYEQVVATSSLRAHITPIRFDYDKTGYACGVHPVSHIHIGLDNQVRLGVNRRLSAVSFVLFVIRHMYPDCWRRLLVHQEKRRLPRSIRHECPAVNAEHWQADDSIELYLG